KPPWVLKSIWGDHHASTHVETGDVTVRATSAQLAVGVSPYYHRRDRLFVTRLYLTMRSNATVRPCGPILRNLRLAILVLMRNMGVPPRPRLRWLSWLWYDATL